jgi:hypothetical protein
MKVTDIRTFQMPNRATLSMVKKKYDGILPNELVSQIQYLSLPDFENDWKFTELETVKSVWAALSRLLLVSKRWNSITRSTPQLWTLIYLGSSKKDMDMGLGMMISNMNDLWRKLLEMDLERFRLFLSRSRDVPIFVVIRSRERLGGVWRHLWNDSAPEKSNSLIGNIMDTLRHESSRIRALSLQGQFSSDWPENTPFNSIRYLDIDYSLHNGRIAPVHGLRCLRIRNLKQDSLKNASDLDSIDASSLVEIQLDKGGWGILPFLQRCTSLKKLVLNYCGSIAPVLEAQSVQIPEVHIRTFTNDIHVLSILSWANARHLAIHNAGPAVEVPFTFPLTSSIVSLAVSWDHATVQDWLRILTAVPSLQALSVLGPLGGVGSRLLVALRWLDADTLAHAIPISPTPSPMKPLAPHLCFLRLQLGASSVMRKGQGAGDPQMHLHAVLEQRPQLHIDIVRPPRAALGSEDVSSILVKQYPERVRVGRLLKEDDIPLELAHLAEWVN